MGTNQRKLRKGQKERLRNGVIRASRYYKQYFMDKIFIIVTEDYNIIL